MRYWVSDAFEWAVAIYFIAAAALLPFALAGGVLYLARAAWGVDP